jgi:citrate lyase subunit beta/citryl-CoA lyase
MTVAPDGIVLPKAAGGRDVALLDARLAVREALHGLEDGATRIVVLATETPGAIFALGSYGGASPRLAGLAWSADDLSAAIGAATSRIDGAWSEPMRVARSLTLFAAAAAGVQAIDGVYGDYKDAAGLKRDCDAARRDGFTGKLAIHPDQVAIINAAFGVSAAALEEAERIVSAFEAAGSTGVIGLDGRMLDQPHLNAARRTLAAAGRSPAAGNPQASAEAETAAAAEPEEPGAAAPPPDASPATRS